jgi:hypothetical protein
VSAERPAERDEFTASENVGPRPTQPNATPPLLVTLDASRRGATDCAAHRDCVRIDSLNGSAYDMSTDGCVAGGEPRQAGWMKRTGQT